MKKKLLVLLPFAVFVHLTVYSQSVKKISRDEQAWLSYYNQTRLSKDWGFTFDLSYRQTGNFVEKPFQSSVRGGIVYFGPGNLKVAAGYAFFELYPGSSARTVAQPEHRIWEQVQWLQNTQYFSVKHHLRLEQRYRRKYKDDAHLANDYNFNHRLRYSLGFYIPLTGKESTPGTLSLAFSDELMVNFGKEIVYNYFDQNRLHLGFAYQLTRDLSLQLGYMNVFQQQHSGSSFNQNHVIRFSIYHNLDFRTPHEE